MLWISSKKPLLHRGLTTVAMLAGFYFLAPETAFMGAPFSGYPNLMIAYYSCNAQMAGISFCTGSEYESEPWFHDYCVCTNENAFSTMAYCYSEAYPEQMNNLLSLCNEKFNTSWTEESLQQALSYYRTFAKNATETSISSVDYPYRLLKLDILTYRASYDQFLGNYNRSIDYGFYLVWFWAVILCVAAMGNWAKILFPAMTQKCNGGWIQSFRRHISLPATFGSSRTNEYTITRGLSMLVPTRAETAILVAFSLLTLHLMTMGIVPVANDPIYPVKMQALMRYYAVRLGILASYLLPFLILFAGRNNILQSFTRWEYSTFVMFHRWISRMVVLLVLLHGIFYTVLVVLKNKNEAYVWWGVAGGAAGVLLCIQGMLALRRRWYEAFLALHIVLALVFVIGACLHVKSLYFLSYYYCSACLWMWDRGIRLQRLLTFGFPVAKVQLFEDLTLKVIVPKPSLFDAEGGGHCFVHFLRWGCFWQSHPFTYTVVDGHIVFYIKVKDGVTTRLRRFLENNPGRTAHIRVAVEGSYGEATPASRYDTSVFIAGGNGIPGIYAELVEAAKANRLGTQDAYRRVLLVWVVRDYNALLWFYDELSALKPSGIETRIYVTRPVQQLVSRVDDKLALLHNTYTHYHATDTDPVGTLKRNLSHVQFVEGRPDIHKLVRSSAEESYGSTAFVTCGHPVMVDEVRHEVVCYLGEAKHRVDYFEQLQVWA